MTVEDADKLLKQIGNICGGGGDAGAKTDATHP